MSALANIFRATAKPLLLGALMLTAQKAEAQPSDSAAASHAVSRKLLDKARANYTKIMDAATTSYSRELAGDEARYNKINPAAEKKGRLVILDPTRACVGESAAGRMNALQYFISDASSGGYDVFRLGNNLFMPGLLPNKENIYLTDPRIQMSTSQDQRVTYLIPESPYSFSDWTRVLGAEENMLFTRLHETFHYMDSTGDDRADLYSDALADNAFEHLENLVVHDSVRADIARLGDLLRSGTIGFNELDCIIAGQPAAGIAPFYHAPDTTLKSFKKEITGLGINAFRAMSETDAGFLYDRVSGKIHLTLSQEIFDGVLRSMEYMTAREAIADIFATGEMIRRYGYNTDLADKASEVRARRPYDMEHMSAAVLQGLKTEIEKTGLAAFRALDDSPALSFYRRILDKYGMTADDFRLLGEYMRTNDAAGYTKKRIENGKDMVKITTFFALASGSRPLPPLPSDRAAFTEASIWDARRALEDTAFAIGGSVTPLTLAKGYAALFEKLRGDRRHAPGGGMAETYKMARLQHVFAAYFDRDTDFVEINRRFGVTARTLAKARL